MTTSAIENNVAFKNILVATDFSDASRHAVESGCYPHLNSEAEAFPAARHPSGNAFPYPWILCRPKSIRRSPQPDTTWMRWFRRNLWIA